MLAHPILANTQMLQTLVELELVALLQHSSVWLAVEPRVAWLLDMCCTGQMEGGPGTARETAAVLGLQLPPPPAPFLPPPLHAHHQQRQQQVDQQQQQREEKVGPNARPCMPIARLHARVVQAAAPCMPAPACMTHGPHHAHTRTRNNAGGCSAGCSKRAPSKQHRRACGRGAASAQAPVLAGA